MKLEWTGRYARWGAVDARIAQVRDCINEDGGMTYCADVPRDMTPDEIIEDFCEGADYNGPVSCSLTIFDGCTAAIDDTPEHHQRFICR